jgi:hypothetical protein
MVKLEILNIKEIAVFLRLRRPSVFWFRALNYPFSEAAHFVPAADTTS